MMIQLDASTLSLKQVHYQLKLERRLADDFASFLSLESLTPNEQQDLDEIAACFLNYYEEGKIDKGEIKFLTLSPLIWLAGFYASPLKISLEENIVPLAIEDEATVIKGRMDIFITTQTGVNAVTHPFWILVIEAKNSAVNALEGLPQLLAYAYKSLQQQDHTWGLTTNGMDYQFVLLVAGDPPTYKLFPRLSLIQPASAYQLLQVLKAIAHHS